MKAYRVYMFRAGQPAIFLAGRTKRSPVLSLTANEDEAYEFGRRSDANADARHIQTLMGDKWTVGVEEA